MKPTAGDTRCVVFGHLARMAIWNLRPQWNASAATSEKLKRVGDEMARLGNLDSVMAAMKPPSPMPVGLPLFTTQRTPELIDAIAF